MDYGIALTPTAAAGEVAARAEALGFSHVWFYDTQLLCHDILVAMTAAALKTRHIKLCAGVLVPANRLAAVAANAMASLNALAPVLAPATPPAAPWACRRRSSPTFANTHA